MKVTVDAASLRTAIDWAAGHTGTQTPIMSAVVLVATAGRLTVSGADNDVWADQDCEAHVITGGTVAVSGRLARAVAKILPADGRVDLDSDGVELNIAAGRMQAGLPLMPVEDYPTPPAKPDIGLVLPVGLGHALGAAEPLAVDLEEKETAGQGCGCELTLEPAGVRVTATSRYRLFTTTLPWPNGPAVAEARTVPLAASTVAALAEIADYGGRDEPVRLGLPDAGHSVLSLACGTRTLGCRTSAGKMIDWRKILVASPPDRSLAVDSAELADLIKKLVPTNDSVDVKARRHLHVDVRDGTLRLATDRASNVIDVAADGPWNTDPWPMMIDSGYLLDIVNAAGAGNRPILRVDFTGPKKPWRITRPESDHFDGAIMPIRIPESR